MTKTRHILALICALLMLSCSAAFAAPQQQEAPRPTLSVDGQGTGTATPDMATVTIGVTTQGEDAAKAQNDNAWVSNQIQSAVRSLGIEEKDRIEIFVDGESIILRKYQPACIFCDNAKDIINYKGKNICPDCIRAMNEKL